jgi:SAM-dependent methyltransferase
MSSLPLGRRVLKRFHPEGIPGIATHIYNAVSKTRIFQRNYDLVAQDVLAHSPGGAILDVGTGPGWLLVALYRRSSELELLGIDISSAMVQRAGENLHRVGLSEAVEVQQADAGHLPFEDGRFDVVVSTGSIHHWKDPRSSLGEIFRVLKPGGYALLYDIVSDTPRDVLRENAKEFGRLRTLLLWLHSYEEPFYSEEALQSLAPRSPFQGGTTRFVGVLCCLTMQKGVDDPKKARADPLQGERCQTPDDLEKRSEG